MSTAAERSYPALLQGVSQQIARDRLPGQVQAQENMLADLVTGLRRRPGARYEFDLAVPGANTDTIRAWYTDIAGETVHVILDTSDGKVRLLDGAYSLLDTLDAGAYLTVSDKSKIRATTVGDEFFLLNTEQAPTLGTPTASMDPNKRGAFYVVAGAFSKEYSVTITTSLSTFTASYTTPNGTGVGDAALATPAYIAGQLKTQIAGAAAALGIAVYIETAYVYVESLGTATSVTVNSSSGTAYLIPSKDSYFAQQGNLPAVLPTQADGYIVRVGDVRTPQYYQYDSTTTAWLESGVFGSPPSIENMPIAITKVAGVWTLVGGSYEGRFAGDDTSNPTHRFATMGITGMGTFQGRLVLLSGPLCSMSAAGKPRRFYRSTVTSVLEGDPIEAGSSANSSAAYEYALPFMKDLVLFSKEYQALVPSSGAIITPRNATVMPTSSHAMDPTCSPVLVGRTLMYSTPRSQDFFGVFEMIPSQFTDSQFTSVDSTQHIPKYMGGRCRFGVSSGVSGLALFGPTGDKQSLIVHEYLWDNDTKQQQAWHRWTFPYEIATAYFAREIVHILFVQNGLLVGCTIDPRVGILTSDAERRPFLDLYSTATITDNVVTPPAWLQTFDPLAYEKVKLTLTTGALAGEAVGFSIDGTDLRTVRSHPSGPVAIGFPYRSSMAPTRPVAHDQNERPIASAKHTVLRYLIGTANSSEYKVALTDRNGGESPLDVGTLYWSSPELQLSQPRRAGESLSVVPARTNADSTVLEIYTEGAGELNITSLDYVSKINLKIRRR